MSKGSRKRQDHDLGLLVAAGQDKQPTNGNERIATPVPHVT